MRFTGHDRRSILTGHRGWITLADADLPLGSADLPEVGHRFAIHPQVEVEVAGRRREKGGWRIILIRHDHRPRLLHRDSSHGYTQIPAMAMTAEPESPSKRFLDHDRIERNCDLRDAERRCVHAAHPEIARLRDRLKRAGSVRTARTILREIRRAEEFVAQAA